MALMRSKDRDDQRLMERRMRKASKDKVEVSTKQGAEDRTITIKVKGK